jgi:glycerophosphoryl diester phosphodiesterase
MKATFHILIISILLSYASCVFAQPGKSTTLRKPKNDIYVIAHRGIHDLLPENSMPAYWKAIGAGCDFLEVDIRTTKDSILVSVHNAAVDEYDAGKHGKIKDLTLGEIQSIDLGHNTLPEQNKTKIPTFEEILQLCKGRIGIYLDLKDASVKAIVDLLRKYEMENDVLWYIPVHDKNIEKLRKHCLECQLMPDFGSSSNLSQAGEIHVLATDMDHLSRRLTRLAHRKNILVFCDDSEESPIEWKKMIDMNADGIQTDKPEKLIRFLEEQKTNRIYLKK